MSQFLLFGVDKITSDQSELIMQNDIPFIQLAFELRINFMRNNKEVIFSQRKLLFRAQDYMLGKNLLDIFFIIYYKHRVYNEISIGELFFLCNAKVGKTKSSQPSSAF